MIRYRAVVIMAKEIIYKEFRSQEQADTFDMEWTAYATESQSFGDINGEDYIVVYYVDPKKEE